MHDKVERIESVKAGSLGGLAAGVSYGVIVMIEKLIHPTNLSSVIGLSLETAIAIITGFLFGITYRYVIRTDRNHHLNSGAVLAFGLVRGLAQIDVSKFELSQVLMDGFIVGKSILLFEIARYVLDRALEKSWVLPFAQDTQSPSSTHIAPAVKKEKYLV
jgi:hypothetical protein